MKLVELGLDDDIKNVDIGEFELGRVIAEHKERYVVSTKKGDINAEIDGRLRFDASDRADFPAVGDWVKLSIFDSMAIIHDILPRKTTLARLAVGEQAEKQIIATNIDYAIILLAVDRDFNINRVERYLTICNSSGIKPIVVLNKIDLIDEKTLQIHVENVKNRLQNTPVVASSNVTEAGYKDVLKLLEKRKTYCLLGSSGVGKSTLLNRLLGNTKMETAGIGQKSNRGKHVTTHRELVVIKNGAIIIDNPGMREVGVTDVDQGLEDTFSVIVELSSQCKFRDCAHENEPGCAVLEAIETGVIDKESFDNYLRLNRERAHYESSVAERRKKDKAFGKMVKQHKDKKDTR